MALTREGVIKQLLDFMLYILNKLDFADWSLLSKGEFELLLLQHFRREPNCCDSERNDDDDEDE